jgi:hypothetical protein
MSVSTGPPAVPLTERIGDEMARLRRVRQTSLQLRAKAVVARAKARARRMAHQIRHRTAAAQLLLTPRALPPRAQRPWRAGATATTPATARARAGDLAYFWAWAEIDLGLPQRYPAPASAVSRFVADHLQGLRPRTEAALLARYRQKLPGGKARPGPHSLATISLQRSEEVEIRGRAAAAVRAWIEAASLTVGPLFRSLDRWCHVGRGLSDRGVAEIVKRRAALAGYDPAEFGGRSLGAARAAI